MTKNLSYLHSAYLPRGKYALKTVFQHLCEAGHWENYPFLFPQTTCPELYTSTVAE